MRQVRAVGFGAALAVVEDRDAYLDKSDDERTLVAMIRAVVARMGSAS